MRAPGLTGRSKADARVSRSAGRPISSAGTKHGQEELEHVDEVEVQGQRAEDRGLGRDLAVRGAQLVDVHLLQLLRVVVVAYEGLATGARAAAAALISLMPQRWAEGSCHATGCCDC